MIRSELIKLLKKRSPFFDVLYFGICKAETTITFF